MVFLAMAHGKAVGEGLEPSSLRRDLDIGRDIGSVHDQSEPLERRVLQSVLEQDRLKAAAAVDVAQLDSAHVIGMCALSLGDGQHLRRGHVQELSIRNDEALDQPGAGDSVDAGVFAGHPLHLAIFVYLLSSKCRQPRISAQWRSCSRSCPSRSRWRSCSSRSPCWLTGSAIGSAGGAISRSPSGLSHYLFFFLPACRKTVRTDPCLPTSGSCCSCSQVGRCSCSATRSSPSGRGRVPGWRWFFCWSRRWRISPGFSPGQRRPTAPFKPSRSIRSRHHQASAALTP